MTKDSVDEILAVSRHELGHWLAAKEYSFNEDYIRVLLKSNMRGGRGINAYSKSYPMPDLPDIESVSEYLKRRVVALQCGVISEFMDCEGVVNIAGVDKAFETSAENDYRQITELLSMYKGIRFSGNITKPLEQSQFSDSFAECWQVGIELIKANYVFISGVSAEMAKRLAGSQNGIKFEKVELNELWGRFSLVGSSAV